MSDTKVSQLPVGDPALTTDEIPVNRSGVNYSVTAGSIAALATAPTVNLVAAPDHYNSPGQAGQIAVGNDGGSPPLSAFFVCLVSEVISPPSDALWLRINSAGAFSTTF